MANELIASARRPRIGVAGPHHLFTLGSLIALLLVASLLALPLWPWSSGFDYEPSGYLGVIDLSLIAALVGRG